MKNKIKFDLEKIKNFPTWEDVSKEIYSKEELDKMEKNIIAREKIRNALSANVAFVLAQYMLENQIGFNELVRRLHMSTATVSKILKGNANVTLDTIAEIRILVDHPISFTV